MGTCIVNDACLWVVLPLHRVCLPTGGSMLGTMALHVRALLLLGCVCPDGFLHTCYNHVQRQMPWLKHRWRMQWAVIRIVICKIPWINWVLNVYTASKHSWKLVPIIVSWGASEGALKTPILDGVDDMIVCTCIQAPLLALHDILGSKVIVLPCFNNSSCNACDVGFTDPLNLSI